jgi:diadenosine tetraphosphate (Ap4A) HIT family hydrolase
MPPFVSGELVVHPRAEDAAVPGWFIIAPARHVEQWDELSPREQQELGPLIGRVMEALRAETQAEKIYVSVFAELVAHLHVHLIARTADVPPESRGPRIFLAAGADPVRTDAIAKGVLARLSGAA